jgi:hypothetical protein
MQEYTLRAGGWNTALFRPSEAALFLLDSAHSHFASNDENCSNMGTREALLGYNLKH